MADTTKNTYKYIDTDIDMDDLVANIDHNLESYLAHKKWDQSKIDEFTTALDEYMGALAEGRLSSVRGGAISDSAGILNNGTANYRDAAGNVISQEDYDAMRRRKKKGVTQNFYANREVASYINQIAKGLYNKSKSNGSKKNTPEFNIYGLWSGFTNSLAPNGTPGDLAAWLALDPYDETTGKRGTSKRAERLYNYINTYIDQIPEDYDFSGTSFKDRESYVNALRGLQSELLRNGVDENDFMLLNSLGGDPAQYRQYFTTNERWEELTDEEKAARKTEEERKKRNEALNKTANDYANRYTQAGYGMHQITNPGGIKYQPKKNESDDEAYLNALNYYNVRFDPEDLMYEDGSRYANYLPQYAEHNPDAVSQVRTGQYAGWTILPGSFNYNDGSVLGFNKRTGTAGRIPYWMLGREAREEFKSILESLYDDAVAEGQPLFMQQGGNVPVEEEETVAMPATGMIGRSSAAMSSFYGGQRQQSQITKADTTRRQVGQPPSDYSDNKFTAEDQMRLASAAMDIGALISPEAVSSLGLGLGSDVTNFVADLREGYGFGKSIGNFAMNLGLSAFGIIPVFGQGLGSGSKVVKSLVKLAPKLGKVVMATGVLNAVTNGPELMASLNKIGKDGPENKMDARDWRNVMMLIQLALGGTNALKNTRVVKGINSNLAKTTKGAVRVDAVNTKTGELERLVFDNKTSGIGKELKAAYESGDPTKVNDVLHRYKSLADHEVITTEHVERSWNSGEEGRKFFDPRTWRKTTKTDRIAEGAVSDMVYPGEVMANLEAGRIEDIGLGNARMQNVMRNRMNRFAEPGQRFAEGNPYRNITTEPTYTLEESIARRQAAAPAAAPAAVEAAAAATGNLHLRPTSIVGAKAPVATNPISAKVQGMSTQELIRAAREAGAYLAPEQIQARAQAGQYSEYFRRLLDLRKAQNPGISERSLINDLLGRGFLRQGGRLNYYQQGGYIKKKNYGLNYTGNDDDWYANGEYGVIGPVSLSAIEAANAGKRDNPNLTTLHGAEGYDYTNAQANTDRARAAWQERAGNREADFQNWVRNWYANPANAGKGRDEALAEYNNLIDQMYRYKHEMGVAPYVGEGSYRHGNEVGQFNRTNRDIYGSANSAGGVHGYSEGQEDWNGTTTAQRFIDRTDDEVNNFNWIFGEGDNDEYRDFFNGLVKDRYGRYYYESPDEAEVTEEAQAGPSSNTQPALGNSALTEPEDEEEEPGKTSENGGVGSYFNMLPEALAASRYAASLGHNRRQRKLSKQMPVLLYKPMEHYTPIEGNEKAIQGGLAARGQLTHMAETPLTSNGALQTAAQMNAYMKGTDYVNQGYAANDQAVAKTIENARQARLASQQNRHEVSEKNKENLFQHRVNDINAEQAYKRANYESLNALLGQFESDARTQRQKVLNMRYSLEASSLSNSIAADMLNNGIQCTQDEQDLVNSVLSGAVQYSDLSDEDQRAFSRLQSQIQEMVTKRIASRYGIPYTPYQYGQSGGGGGWSPEIIGDRRGGVIGMALGGKFGDTEKIALQKLRGKFQKMQVFQKHLEARMNAFEKDLDRAQKGAADYIKGQKKK